MPDRQWPRITHIGNGVVAVRTTKKVHPAYRDAMKKFIGEEEARLGYPVSQTIIEGTSTLEGNPRFNELYQQELKKYDT